jgi:hypothetical protein
MKTFDIYIHLSLVIFMYDNLIREERLLVVILPKKNRFIRFILLHQLKHFQVDHLDTYTHNE